MLARVFPALLTLRRGTDFQAIRMSALFGRGASRDARVLPGQRKAQPGPDPRGQDPFVEDSDMADIEEKLQALESQEKRRRGAVKLQRIKRQMTPPGPPERTLSWDAMEQIRFLRQESPEEWSVGRLAEGFSVSPDIVRRVLQSRFIPSAERRQKQDSRAWARAGQRSLPAHHSQERLELPGGAKANTMLPTGTGSMEANMLTAAKGSALPTLKMQMMEPGQDKVTVAPTAGSVVPASLTVLQSPWPPSSHSEKTTVQELHAERHPTSTGVQPHMQEEEWDGWVLSDEELEELATALPAQNCQVVQKGREFFDKEGNFLYRI